MPFLSSRSACDKVSTEFEGGKSVDLDADIEFEGCMVAASGMVGSESDLVRERGAPYGV